MASGSQKVTTYSSNTLIPKKDNASLSNFKDDQNLIYTYYGGSNGVSDKPTSVDAFGVMSFKTADGWYGQLLMSSNTATGLYWRTATSLSGGWRKLLDSSNYTDYTVTKTGSGASGTWGISITGNAGTATKLATARNIQTNLASTATASFDGSANITPGVTGVLPIANGGTGVTTEALIRATYGIEYIVGTQTASTNVWTGVTSSTALYTGKTIAYYLPYAGTSTAATLNLTLSGGSTTGAKNVRINNSNVTTHFPAGTVILLVYDGTYWKVDNYDSNSNTLLRVYSSATNLNVPLIGQSSANNVNAAWTSYTGTYKDWYGAIPNDDALRAKINLSTGHITVPGGITANVTGNATTATAFASGTTVKLTGDVTGESSSSTKGWSIATTIGAGKVTNSMLAGSITKDKLDTTIFKTFTRADIGTSPNYDNPGVVGLFEVRKTSETSGETGTKPVDSYYPILSMRSENVMLQLAGANHTGYWIRGKQAANVTLSGVNWVEILTSDTYNNYAPTKDGIGANGTWGISISGNANSATWANYLSNASHSVTINASNWDAPNPWNAGNRTLVWGQQGITSASSDTADIILCYGTTSASNGAGWFLDIDGGIYSQGPTYGAVWNDYAEFRKSNIFEGGRVITPMGECTTKRLEVGTRIVSDTYGYAIGYMENQKNNAPVALSGRVLAYPYKDKSEYKIGDAVCSAPGGTIDVMTREEIMTYPDRIIGIVNEIPDYDIWEPSLIGNGRDPVYINGRIWIDVH